MFLLGAVIGVGLPLLLNVERGFAIALALGVPSLIYGSIQFADAADTIDKLARLEQQLPTRQLGTAPDFMRQIIKMLSGAQQRVIICCDFPAYGAITDASEYAQYVRAIRHLRRDVEIRLLHLDKDAQSEIAKDSYRRNGNKTSTGEFENNEDGFLRCIVEKNRSALEEQFRDAEKFETSFLMPLFFWIVDDEAVFALRQMTKKGDGEVGFQTSDGTLIKALGDIFSRYTQMNEKYELTRKTPTVVVEPGAGIG
jgi:hypothetical protein